MDFNTAKNYTVIAQKLRKEHDFLVFWDLGETRKWINRNCFTHYIYQNTLLWAINYYNRLSIILLTVLSFTLLNLTSLFWNYSWCMKDVKCNVHIQTLITYSTTKFKRFQNQFACFQLSKLIMCIQIKAETKISVEKHFFCNLVTLVRSRKSESRGTADTKRNLIYVYGYN